MLFQLNDLEGSSKGLLEVQTNLEIEEVENIVTEIGRYCLEEHDDNFMEMVLILLSHEEGILSASRVFVTEIDIGS